MTRFTKKYMIEDYMRLYAHAELMELYLYDTQTGRKPDGVEKSRDKLTDNCRVELYRATSASGGYVVIWQGNTNIFLLDDISKRLADDHSVYSLGLRVCLERLTMLRNKLSMEKDGPSNPVAIHA